MRTIGYGITHTSRVLGQDGELHHDRLPDSVRINRPFMDTTGSWAYTFDGVSHGGHSSYHAARVEAVGFIRGILAHLDRERAEPEGTLLNGGIVSDRGHFVPAGRTIDVAVVEHDDGWAYTSDGILRGGFDSRSAAEEEALGFARGLLYIDGHRTSGTTATNDWLVLRVRRT